MESNLRFKKLYLSLLFGCSLLLFGGTQAHAYVVVNTPSPGVYIGGPGYNYGGYGYYGGHGYGYRGGHGYRYRDGHGYRYRGYYRHR